MNMNLNKIDDLLTQAKIKELVGKKPQPVVVEEKKKVCPLVWVLAVLGFVAAVAGIAYAVYRYFSPDYLEDFEDEEFEDEDEEFEDDFFAEDDEPATEE